MADKTAFTSKDIERAFGISNREQVYWVDQGYLEPDIQSERPRLYSTYSAMKAGAIRYFETHGYKLERAHRLAVVSMVAAYLANMSFEGSSLEDAAFDMKIVNGIFGLVMPKSSPERPDPIFGFSLSANPTGEGSREPIKEEVYSQSDYRLRDLLTKWATALGGDRKDVRLPSLPKQKFKLVRKEGAVVILEFEGDQI